MSEHYLNLEAFRASRKEVANICTELGIYDDRGIVPGFTYDGGCYIEKRDEGGYYTVIERGNWIFDDLENLERLLWANWYLHQFDHPTVDDADIDDVVLGIMDSMGHPDFDGGVVDLFLKRDASPLSLGEVESACWRAYRHEKNEAHAKGPAPRFWKVGHKAPWMIEHYYFGGSFEGATPAEAIAAAKRQQSDDGGWVAYPADRTGRMI